MTIYDLLGQIQHIYLILIIMLLVIGVAIFALYLQASWLKSRIEDLEKRLDSDGQSEID